MAVMVIASPISLTIGAITYSIRKNDQKRFSQAVVVAILAFLFIVFFGLHSVADLESPNISIFHS
jgi:hypothetical protein